MRRRLFGTGVILLGLSALAMAQAQTPPEPPPEPARLLDGSIPGMTPFATAGGNVVLSVAVLPDGHVGTIDVLRTTPPYTDALVESVRAWRFSPALDSKRRPIDAHVLVSSVIRPPDLYSQTVGTPPKDLRTTDTRVPFPAQSSTPPYPVNAHAGGSVLVESRIDKSGHVVGVTTVKALEPFNVAALDAARSATFRPAEGPDVPPVTYAYQLFVFRAPVVGAGSPGTGGFNPTFQPAK